MYALGHILLPEAYAYSPDLTSPIIAALQNLLQSVPAEMTQDETYKNVGAGAKKDLNDVVRDTDKNPDSKIRDARYLAVVYDLWQQSDFAEAARVNDKISNTDVRGKLSTLI